MTTNMAVVPVPRDVIETIRARCDGWWSADPAKPHYYPDTMAVLDEAGSLPAVTAGHLRQLVECLSAAPLEGQGETFTVDDLAQEIRRVDGDHSLGAGALAEALAPFIVGKLIAYAERSVAAHQAPVSPAEQVVPRRYANDAAARVIYDGWSDLPGWVPWVEHGNSERQDQARREATPPADRGIV